MANIHLAHQDKTRWASLKAQIRLKQGASQLLPWWLHLVQVFEGLCLIVGIILLGAGIAVGWGAPVMGKTFPFAGVFLAPIPRTLSITTLLAEDITALGVLIAVLIGYNIAALQLAGQRLAIAPVRAIVRALVLLLLVWIFMTGCALVYLVLPPRFVGQLYQLLLWFGAMAVLVIGYLWSLSWRLSGVYVARWIIRDLRNVPLEKWESRDGFAVLQAAMALAPSRADLSMPRGIVEGLGGFLVGLRDRKAEEARTYERARYRALKNLLMGCAQNAEAMPKMATFYLGFVAAAVLLQAIATGQPIARSHSDLFSDLVRVLGTEPDRLDALLAGLRHGLCQPGIQGEPYLLTYWREHTYWDPSDPRRVQQVAEGIMVLLRDCESLLKRVGLPVDEVREEKAAMLSKLYKYLAVDLGQAVKQQDIQLVGLPSQLLELVHQQSNWSPDEQVQWQAIEEEYKEHHTTLLRLRGTVEQAIQQA